MISSWFFFFVTPRLDYPLKYIFATYPIIYFSIIIITLFYIAK